MRPWPSIFSLWGSAILGCLALSGSPLFAQDSSEIRIRDASRPVVLKGHTDQEDPLDKVRNVHCKTYTVMLYRTKAYVIDLVSNDFNAFLRIEDKDGVELASNHSANGVVTNAQLDFTPPRDSTYRIMVESVGGATGQYTFRITPDDPGKALDRTRLAFETQFRQRDKNGDGFLNKDEMSENMKANLSKWDKNNDGLISLEEFLEYRGYKGPPPSASSSNPGVPSKYIYIDEDELERKPSVFRAGKLPAGLPDWFSRLDTDGDGQVALWEWRKGGRGLEEFEEWDLNEDGFLTAEEVLRKLEQDRLAATMKKAN